MKPQPWVSVWKRGNHNIWGMYRGLNPCQKSNHLNHSVILILYKLNNISIHSNWLISKIIWSKFEIYKILIYNQMHIFFDIEIICLNVFVRSMKTIVPFIICFLNFFFITFNNLQFCNKNSWFLIYIHKTWTLHYN